MKNPYIRFFFIVFLSPLIAFSQPSNDECTGAIVLTNVNNWCSANGAYTNVNATQTLASLPTCWTGNVPSHDVWFAFTAVGQAMNIIVDGANGGGTLNRPQIAVFTGTCNPFNFWEVGCTQFTSTNNGYANLYLSGLTIGQLYYIVVDGYNDNTGTFKLCLNNFNPPAAPGQDCVNGAWLCNKDAITQQALVGAGVYETAGTCLDDPYSGPSDKNTIWYKWVCATSGELLFSIDPLIPLDDIDWVFYELPNGNCSSRIALRCNSSACPGATGLKVGATNINIYPGCNGIPNELWCAPVNMVAGKTYGLLINNWTDASVGLNNGFTLTFGGLGEFVGPVSDFTISPAPPYCTGDVITFTNASTGGATNYSWTFGLDASLATSTTQGPHNVSYSSPGTKTIVLTVDDGSCDDVSYQSIVIEDCCSQPTINSQPQNVLICDQTTHTFSVSATGSGTLTYQWQFNSIDIPGATASTYTISPITPANAGSYTCIISDAACTITTNAAILSLGDIPIVDFSGEPLLGCSPLTVEFTDLTQGNSVSWNWNFGDPSSSANTSSIENPSHTFNSGGIYTVTLNITNDEGCTGTLTIPDMIDVQASPIASFSYTPTVVYEDSPTVSFINTSIAGTSYLWSFGDGPPAGTSTLENPVYTFPGTGNYNVQLWVETTNGCNDSINKMISVRPFVTFYVPNAFSPNGDGQNEVFMPYGNSIDTDGYSMTIFDRWGKIVFHTQNLNTPWDGTIKDGSGKIALPGVYTYLINARIEGNDKSYRGIVTLVY